MSPVDYDPKLDVEPTDFELELDTMDFEDIERLRHMAMHGDWKGAMGLLTERWRKKAQELHDKKEKSQ